MCTAFAVSDVQILKGTQLHLFLQLLRSDSESESEIYQRRQVK